MAVCGSLQVQISSVLETLTRTAVQEICKLIHTEHLEMRLQIREGHDQIEALRGKIHDLRTELKKPSLSPLGLIESQQHRDGGVDDLRQESHFQQTDDCMKVDTMRLPTARRGAEGHGIGPSFPGSRTEQSPSCMFSRSDRGVTCGESQIFNDSLPAKQKADTRGRCAAALKVEPAARCQFEVCQADKGQCPSNCVTGGDSGHYGAAEFHPRSPYQNEQLPGQEPDLKYDTAAGHRAGSATQGNPSGVNLKTEMEEEPLTRDAPAMCGDAFPWPPLASVSFEANAGGPGCSSMLHRGVPPRHVDPQAPPPRPGPATLPTVLGSRGLPRAHSHLRPFSCPFCPKSFLSTTDLTRHQRIHTGEKPFGCSICGKRFSLRGNLVTHERAHSGSKPFICRHCGRAFSHGSNLRAHQRIHTGEKPFRCSVCGMTFAWYYPFKRHISLHCVNGTDS